MEQQASSAMHQLDDAHKQIAVLQSEVQGGSGSACDALEGSDTVVQVCVPCASSFCTMYLFTTRRCQ